MIYFLRDDIEGFIKIGTSEDVESRIADLRRANPHPLGLLGTLPGGRSEEAAWHRRFAEYAHGNEWFRGEPDLRHEIGLTLLRSGLAATVGDELRRRDDCRYGLSGVAVGIVGIPGEYLIHVTRWDQFDRLTLALYPAGGDPPRELWALNPKLNAIGVRCLTEYRGLEKPPGYLEAVPADHCILLEDWPCVCCFPERMPA